MLGLFTSFRATAVTLSGEELGYEGERALSGGKSDAVGAEVGDGVEAFEGKCEVGSALVGDESVDFIDDDGLDVAQRFAAAGGGEQNVERLGSGDEDVRRKSQHAGAIADGSVSRAHHGTDGGHEVATLGGELLDLEQREVEIFLHVVAEGFEGRDVEELGVFAEVSGERLADERIYAGEESSQGFAASGGGGDESVAAGEDVRPAGNLRLCGRAEARSKPLAHDGMRPGKMIFRCPHWEILDQLGGRLNSYLVQFIDILGPRQGVELTLVQTMKTDEVIVVTARSTSKIRKPRRNPSSKVGRELIPPQSIGPRPWAIGSRGWSPSQL